VVSKRLLVVGKYLAFAEFALITFVVAAASVFSRLLPLAVGIAVSGRLIHWAGYGRQSERTPADWLVVLLLLTVPVTLRVTVVPAVTHPQVYRLLLGVSLFYALVNWATSTRRLRLLMLGMLYAGLLLALSAPLTVQWSGGKFRFIPSALYARFTPFVTDLVNPNVLAGALVLVLPCAFALVLYAWKALTTHERVVSFVAALVMSGIVVMMQSRGGLVALGAAVVCLITMRWHHGWRLWGMALVGVVATLWLAPTRLVEPAYAASSLESRLELWSRGLYIVQDFPFTGVGMGAFQHVTNALYPVFSLQSAEPHAHNLFLQIAIDLGLPGLIAWLAILMVVVATAWQLYKRGRDHNDRYVTGLGAGLFSSQVSLIVHGLTDAVTWGMVRTAVIVWGSWGLAIAAWKVHEHMPASRSPGPGNPLESGMASTKARYVPSMDRL